MATDPKYGRRDFFKDSVLSVAKAAKEYLVSRGIDEEVQKQFRLGFSPDSWDSLLNHLKEKRSDEKLIEQSGLVSVNEEKDRVFDRFRGRIIFPVLDVDGRPIAFGARAMGDEQPKYLNSPETPAYVKGQHLDLEIFRQKRFDRPARSLDARLVTVVIDYDFTREAP